MTTELTFNREGLGVWTGESRFEVTRERLQEYAAAVNDPIEAHRAGEVANPVFAIVPVFESLFDVFFLGLGEAIKAATEATAAALDMDPDELQRLIEALEALAKEQGIELSELAKALLRADTGTLERLLRDAAERSGIDDIQHGFQE